mmetsp:Transcript_119/g.247  ORF Transcript_119/g.247 Transcript_119/m.247 type:complete len:794 (-) Transcript_119:198-2579(-)
MICLQLGHALHRGVRADGGGGDALVRVGVVRPLLQVQPVRVGHGPLDAVAQGVLEAQRGDPAHLGHLLAGQAVAQVVAGARGVVVDHLVHQLLAARVGDELRQLQVGHLALARDVVLLADGPLVEQEHHRRRDVARVDVEARARRLLVRVRVDVHLLAVHHLLDALGDELLGVLALPEGVHDVDDHERDLVRVFVRDADVLRRALGGRVRVRGLVAIPLVEHRGAQRRPEHLVRAEVEERLEVAAVADKAAGVLEQRDGGLHVVADERHGVADGVVHVRLRRHVHDELDVVAQLVRDALGDGLHQVRGEHLHAVQHAGVAQPVVPQARVGQLVDHHEVAVRGLGEVLHHVVPDEAAPARDDDLAPRDGPRHRDRGRKLLDRVHDVLTVRRRDPPADGDGDERGLRAVQQRQVRAERRAHAVRVVARVHLAHHHVLLLHELDELVLHQDVEREDPVAGHSAGRGLQQRHPVHPLQRLVVEGGVGAVPGDERVQVRQVGQAQGGAPVVHVHLEPVVRHVALQPEVLALVVALVTVDAVPPQQLAARVQVLVGQQQQPAVAGGEVLDGLQAEHHDVAALQAPDAPPLPLRAHGVRRVLDHHGAEPEALKRKLLHLLDLVEVHGRAAPVYELDHLGGGAQLVLEILDVHVGRLGVHVHPLGLQAVAEDGPVGGGACQRRGQHLVARVQPRPRARGFLQHVERERQAAGGAVEREHVGVLQVRAHLVLELLHARALRDVPAHQRLGRHLRGVGRHEHAEQRHLGPHRRAPRSDHRHVCELCAWFFVFSPATGDVCLFF